MKVINAWFSPVGARVSIGLEAKGVKYDFLEENLYNKSELLLEMNPIQDTCAHPAIARFWADFVDKKGKNRRKRRENIGRNSGRKLYFRGETFGLIDIMFTPFSSWFLTYKTLGNFPRLEVWVKKCMERESVEKSFLNLRKCFHFPLNS
eukprot:Gb_31568 [translate_table: standard]